MNVPRLFHCLPKKLRDLKKVTMDKFKIELDKYLATLPVGDLVPTICNQITAKPSNSLLDVSQHQKNMYGGNAINCS